MIEGDVGPIAVHDFGGPGDATLIVAHATGFLGQAYAAFARELNSQVRVVALDFRAHGDSATPDEFELFSWHRMADDLQAVVDYLRSPTLHAFGHSMGGAAVLEVERRSPGTFTSALLFEPIVPAGPFSDTGESPLSKAALGRTRTFATSGEALQRYASRPPLGLFRADVLNDYVRHGFVDTDEGITLKCRPESEAATFIHAGELSLEMLPEIELAVVVGRSGDGGSPAQLARTVATELPNSRLRDFPTLTHFGPLQDPVSVALAMRETLADHPN